MIFKDQLQRELQLIKIPQRIVSLVPSQTELLVDLGLERDIVGVTKFCVHPKHLRMSKVVVGGTKQINLKKVQALKPDIILCNKEENTQEIIATLSAVAPIHISDVSTLNTTYELITMYGAIFEVEEKAKQIITRIKAESLKLKTLIKNSPKPKVAYFIWRKPWMVAAGQTFIDAMLNEAGFDNTFKEATRYPEIKLDNIRLSQADIILLSSEPFPFKAQHVAELQALFLDKEIKIVDGELFSWYGTRLLKSFNYFKSLHIQK